MIIIPFPLELQASSVAIPNTGTAANSKVSAVGFLANILAIAVLVAQNHYLN